MSTASSTGKASRRSCERKEDAHQLKLEKFIGDRGGARWHSKEFIVRDVLPKVYLLLREFPMARVDERCSTGVEVLEVGGAPRQLFAVEADDLRGVCVSVGALKRVAQR